MGLFKSFKSTPVSTPPVPSQKGSKYFHVKITSPECVSISFKGNEFHFKGSQLCEHCMPLLWNGVYFKRKEFAPVGSKFFPFTVDFFRGELVCRETIRIWQKLSPVKYMAENLSNMSIPFKSSTKCTTRWCSYNSPGFHFSHVKWYFLTR